MRRFGKAHEAQGRVREVYRAHLPKGASRFRESTGVLTQEAPVLEWLTSLTFNKEAPYGVTGIDRVLVETLALAVAVLNQCHTCVAVHGARLRQLTGDRDLTDQVTADYTRAQVDRRTRAALAYAAKLTCTPEAMTAEDVAELRGAGYSDNQIVDIAHITALFNYINRIARGLGAELHPDASQTKLD